MCSSCIRCHFPRFASTFFAIYFYIRSTHNWILQTPYIFLFPTFNRNIIFHMLYRTHSPVLTTSTLSFYRSSLFAVDVPRLQTESGEIAPTFPSAPSQSAFSSAPWGLLRYPRKPCNLFPLMGSGPARPDRPRQNSNSNFNSESATSAVSSANSSWFISNVLYHSNAAVSALFEHNSIHLSHHTIYYTWSVNVPWSVNIKHPCLNKISNWSNSHSFMLRHTPHSLHKNSIHCFQQFVAILYKWESATCHDDQTIKYDISKCINAQYTFARYFSYTFWFSPSNNN